MNKHEEAREYLDLLFYGQCGYDKRISVSDLSILLYDYITQCEATEKELDLYRKLIGLMVCVPQNETYHYVVRYTDDVKFSSILNQINTLSKVGEDK